MRICDIKMIVDLEENKYGKKRNGRYAKYPKWTRDVNYNTWNKHFIRFGSDWRLQKKISVNLKIEW